MSTKTFLKKTRFKCSCNYIHEIYTTLEGDINTDICSNCHTFYTGKEDTLYREGSVSRFLKRYGKKY